MLLLIQIAPDTLHLRTFRMENTLGHRKRGKAVSMSFGCASYGSDSPALRITFMRRAKLFYLSPTFLSREAVLRFAALVFLRSYHARVYHFFEFFIIAAMSRRLCSKVCANCIALVLPSLWKAETEKMKPFFLTL